MMSVCVFEGPGRRSGFFFLVLMLKSLLRAGPEPSDTASTTEKLWEGFSPRSATSTWSITSGVRSDHSMSQAQENKSLLFPFKPVSWIHIFPFHSPVLLLVINSTNILKMSEPVAVFFINNCRSLFVYI